MTEEIIFTHIKNKTIGDYIDSETTQMDQKQLLNFYKRYSILVRSLYEKDKIKPYTTFKHTGIDVPVESDLKIKV
jgi:hypothetical protein